MIRTVYKVPIVLAAIDGLWGSIFSYKGGKLIFKKPEKLRGHVKITFSKPLEPENYDLMTSRAWIQGRVGHYHKDESQV